MSGAQRDRLLIFGDPNLTFAGVLLTAYLRELRSRDDIKVLGVCDTARKTPVAEPWMSSIAWLRYLARRGFDSSPRDHSSLRDHRPPAFSRHLHGVARRSGVPIIVPPERNVNHPDFIAQLKSEWKPSLALSLGCLQILQPRLLDVFDMAVNYHDGYLPFYKGLAATAWSLYHRESHSGYTYHRIDGGIDSGPVLVQDRFPVPRGATPLSIRREKTHRAAREAKRVLDLMTTRSAGTPQLESGSYFSAADRRRLSTIDDPGQLSSDEILHRLRCFEILNIRIGGRFCEVTELRETSSRRAFTTEDGITLAPHRMLWLPCPVYHAYRRFRPAQH